MTPATSVAPSASMTLWEIDAELNRLILESTFEIQEQGSVSEATTAALDQYHGALVAKCDNISQWLKHQKNHVGGLKEEKQRITALHKAEEADYDRYRSYLADFLLSRGITEVKGKINKLRLHLNTQDSLDIKDPTALPDEYTMLTVTLPTDYFLKNQESLPIIGRPGAIEPNNAAIRTALACATEVVGCELKRGHHVRVY